MLNTRWNETASDSTICSIVFTGTGRGFCSGADMAGRKETQPSGGAGLDVDRVQPLFTARQVKLYKPVITAVNGEVPALVCASSSLRHGIGTDEAFTDTHVALAKESPRIKAYYPHPEASEGPRAFVEKRPPIGVKVAPVIEDSRPLVVVVSGGGAPLCRKRSPMAWARFGRVPQRCRSTVTTDRRWRIAGMPFRPPSAGADSRRDLPLRSDRCGHDGSFGMHGSCTSRVIRWTSGAPCARATHADPPAHHPRKRRSREPFR